MNTHKVMRQYGFDKFWIELIEEIEIENLADLKYYEGAWQERMIESGYQLTNTRLAGRSDQERNAERIPCPDCGRVLRRNSMARHRRTYHREKHSKSQICGY